MGMQYVIAKCHIDKSSTNGKLRAETINSYGHADVEVGTEKYLDKENV